MLNPSVSEDDELEVVAWGKPALVVPAERPTVLPASFYQRRGKRLLDVTLGVALLAVAAPVMIAASLAVLISSGLPVWYRSRRVGESGHEFWMWKFRTMRGNADAELADLLKASPERRREFELRRKLDADPRVTPVGRILRSLSVDELPQLVNVVWGDMSLVGPRPVPRDELHEMYGPLAARMVAVRPGLTGLWQVSGRCRTTYTERIEYDDRYAAAVSFGGDLAILFATVGAVLRRDGAM